MGRMVGGLRTRRLDEVAARSCGTLRPSPRAVHAARGVGVTVGGQHVARDPGSIVGRIAGVGLPSRLPGKRREFSPICLAGLGPDDLPSSAESIVKGTGNAPQVLEVAPKPPSDIEYLQELIAIQQNGPKNIGFFGTRNMGFLHQQLIEILSYAMVLTDNHIFTSGATGTNAAVIRGALRAERPDLLTVVLPQSMEKQPPESQELLKQVQETGAKMIEMPDNDDLTLFEASSICNDDIISRVQQIICFAFHDSKLLLETCAQAKENKKMVTLFYLD